MLIEQEKIIVNAKKQIEESLNLNHLTQVVKPAFFGKDGVITSIFSQIKSATVEEKKILGQQVNVIKNQIEKMIEERANFFENEAIERQLLLQQSDATLPSLKINKGSFNSITFVANEIISIFEKYGFEINFGPEIETDDYNFTKLNIPKNHPARQMHDTFYVDKQDEDGQQLLLRTHTTCVDIRALLKKAHPPVRTLSFGRVFRHDSDKTHSPMFHQIELLAVEQGLTFSHLKGVIMSFLKHFFETEDVEIRLRPSFFPFTEPSVEVDIKYCIENGRIKISSSGDRYMEILGCGMLNRAVLQNCNIDSKKYKAIALGLGVERMAMLKYGIDDLRQFFTTELDFILNHNFSDLII